MILLKNDWFKNNNLKIVDYQVRLIDECINSLNTQELPVVMAATPSAGKTIMSIYIADYYINQGFKVLVLTHGTTVIRNNYAGSLESSNKNFKYQVFESGDTIKDVDMLITLPQSIKNQNLPKFDLVIIDEAHERYFAKEVQSIIGKIKPKKQLLLTGTPSPFIKSEVEYPIHIVSMQEAYQQGRINDVMVHLCSSSYDIRENDFNSNNDLSIRGNNKLNRRVTEITLDNLLGELHKKLTNVFQGKVGSTVQNIFNWSLTIKQMGKTMIAANSIEQARHIQEYFNNQGIKTLLSTHEDDNDSTQIDLFKNNDEYKILVVVRRGILGFDMSDMVNVIDMTASRNLDRIYQLMSRVVRKNDNIKMKHFIKMAIPNTEATYELVMTAVLCLMSKEYISKFDGRNFGQFEIPIEPIRREINGNTESSSQGRRTNTIRPISILGIPLVDFFEKVFHKDGKVLNTHSISRITDVMYELGQLGNNKPYRYWTYERCKEEALKYKTKSEYLKASKVSYATSFKNGWLDEFFSPKSHWTYETCKEDALKYDTKTKFQKGSKTAYNTSLKNSWLNEFFPSKIEQKPKSHWTYETCKEESLKYDTKTKFQKSCYGAYTASLKNGWLDEFFSPKIGWTYERCKEEALKYKTKSEFAISKGNVYTISRKNSWLNEFFPSKIEQKPKGHWTLERCKEEALKYDTRTKFQKNAEVPYTISRKNGWLDEICTHMVEVMKPKGHWTLERCKEEALKYKTKSEFRENSISAYNTSRKNGWLDEICTHMVEVMKPKGHWTYERCKEESLKYSTRTKFQKNSISAYNTSRKNGWIEEFFPKSN